MTTRSIIRSLMAAGLLFAACGDDTTTTDATTSPGATSPEATAPDDARALPQGDDPYELDPATFTTEIDNPYWPMEVGTRWTYKEVDSEGVEFEVVIVVTTETKLVANGVTAHVVRDTVYEDGSIIEDTFDWYAQDADGNVWYLGEDTAEFEDGEITSTEGSWEAGVDGALPGIAMPGDPQPGQKYRQEFYAGSAEDHGEVLSVSASADTPFDSFTDCVQTADTTPLDPEILEHKFYAAGVGPVLTLDLADGDAREELISVDQAPATAGTGPLGSPNA